MELKAALQNYSLCDLRKLVESAATDTKYVLIGKLGSRRIIQEGLTGSVSINDLWAAAANKSKNAVSPGEVEDTRKAVAKLDIVATQKLKTKGLAKVLHFLPHFFGGIGAGRKKNMQSIHAKIAELKSTHTQAAEVDRIGTLINSKADLNAEDGGGQTELMRAIENGYPEVVKLLINNGASPTQPSSRYLESPLNRALSLKNFEIAEVLVKAGADVNSADPKTGNRPLENALHEKNPEAVEFLMKNHAVSNFYHNGMSPLNLALQNNDKITAQTLIQGGADVNSVNPDTGNTPLISAIYAGNKEAVEFLLDKGAELEIPSKVGSPLYVAVTTDKKEIADLLLEKGANPNAGSLAKTPLIYLIEKGDREGVEKLIKKGANLNASAATVTPLMTAMQTNNRYYATRLVDAGADINYREPLSHETVLGRACRKGNKADIEFLVGLGASAAPQDVAFRYTPLGIILLQSESPDKWDIAETLITHGPVDLNKFDGYNSTFLNTVITSGNLKAVELILKHGKNIDLNYTDLSIPLPLQVALERKSEGLEIAELLIKEGADIKQKDTYGDTSLHRAIQQKRLDNAAFLIARWGGDLTQPVNATGETPLQLLQASNDPQMKALIPNP